MLHLPLQQGKAEQNGLTINLACNFYHSIFLRFRFNLFDLRVLLLYEVKNTHR